jgi:PAS domain S-box-containing protein
MNREELQRLSVDELVEMVLDLQQVNRHLHAQQNIPGEALGEMSNGGNQYTPESAEHDVVVEGSEPAERAPPTGEPQQAKDPSHVQRDLDEQLQRTALLLQLSIEFRETLEPTIIIERMLHVMMNNLHIANASVVLIGLDNSVDLAMTMRDSKVQQITTPITRAVLDRGLGGWVLRHGRSVVLPDVSRDKRWIPYESWQESGSAIVLPIRQAQTTLGVLTVYHAEPNHFTSRDMLLMEGVAAQAGMALGSSRRYYEENRRREQALALLSMSQFLTVERTMDDLASMVHEKSVSIFGVDYGLLFVSNDDIHLKPVALPPELSHAANKLLMKQTAMTARKAWEQKNIMTDADSPVKPTRSFMALPLLHSGKAIGAIVLVRTSGDDVTFSANTWSMLTTFTNVIATTCENMKLVEQLKHQTTLLESVVEERTNLLQRSRNFLRVVFDNLPEGLVLLDQHEVLMAANNAFCYDIIGRHPRTIVGETLSEIWVELEQRGEMVIERRNPSELLHGGGEESGILRVRCTNARGQYRWYEVNRLPVTGREGEVSHYIEQWFDVTHQEELQRRILLQDQRSMLGHLTSRVVHDISGPLREVIGNLHLCSEEEGLSEQVQEHMNLAQDGLDRIERMLESLTQLYKAPRMTWECFDINEVLYDVYDFAEEHGENQAIRFYVHVDQQIPLLYGQPDALRQVFLGIVFNAIEAMPEGGDISLISCLERNEAGQPTGMCRVCIRDTGKGMSPDQVAHLFEPFKSNKSRGMGMGLYLSKQIVEQHSGRLEVTSKKQEGTIVDVYLPIDDRCR